MAVAGRHRPSSPASRILWLVGRGGDALWRGPLGADEHAYPETMPIHHTFMPSTSWLEGIEKQRWKQWDLSPERYIDNALRFDWSNQSRVLLDAVAALNKERLG